MDNQFSSVKNDCETNEILLLKDIRNICSNISNLLQLVHQRNVHEMKTPQLIFNASNAPVQNKLQSIIEVPTVNGFHEIAGLAEIKRILTALVLLPKYQPQLCIHHKCVNTILLYGPPGTGKTKLVHAVASEYEYILHSLANGELLSSYVGVTEKNIQEIFYYLKQAKQYSILFIDEIDSLCRKRNSMENDYSRRIKTELMNQLNKIENCSNIIIIAATNCPWDLDSAILRRFQKKVYVPLPNFSDRKEIFQLLIKDQPGIHNSEEFNELIEHCDGLSGSDITNIINEAFTLSLSELADTKIWQKLSDGMYQPYTTDNQDIKNINDMETIQIVDLKYLPPYSIKPKSITIMDLIQAAQNIQTSVTFEDIQKYEEFNRKYSNF